jgi:hypothetical protein
MKVAGNRFQHDLDIDQISQLNIVSENNLITPVPRLWANSNVVIVFIRHFGCLVCRAHVEQLLQYRDQLKLRRTELVFVGNGSPHMISAFKKNLAINEACIYTDPTRQLFKICGMKYNPLRMLDIRGILNIKEFFDQGYRQGEYSRDNGSLFQLGGVLAINKAGKIVYHFISEFVGDFDNPSDWPD